MWAVKAGRRYIVAKGQEEVAARVRVVDLPLL
jgi:hypothetical protein